MNMFRLRLVFVMLVLCVPLLAASSSFASLLPDNLVIEDEFKPGYGMPVGKIQLLQGDVVVIHADQLRGYWAQKFLPLYQGDTIVTLENGKVRLGLNDGSTLTLTNDTKLTINLSVYNPNKKVRSSFFNMVFGKVLFAVRKLADFTSSQVKTKTFTAVVGVRGSQWVEEVTDAYTEITALINTKLGIIGTAYPEDEPVILNDFDQVTVYEGQRPGKVVKVSNKQLKQFEEDFTIIDDGAKEYKGGPVEGYHEVGPSVILPVDTLVPPDDGGPPDFGDIQEHDNPQDDEQQFEEEIRPALADLPPPPTR